MNKSLIAFVFCSAVAVSVPAAATTVTVDIPDLGSSQYIGSGTASVTYSGVTFSTSASYSDGQFWNYDPAFTGGGAVLSTNQATFGAANILITLPTLASAITINYSTSFALPVTFALSSGGSSVLTSGGTGYITSDVYSSGPSSPFAAVQIKTSAKAILNVGSITYTIASVPEPASWGMMIVGFGLTGGALRRREAMRAAA